MVRAEALDAWNQRQQQARLTADPSIRDKEIQRSLVVQRVIAKEGRKLILGQFVEEEEDNVYSSEDDEDAVRVVENDHQCSLVVEEDSDEENSDCAICLENFRVGDVVAFGRAEASDCHHPFHRECILLWFTKRNDCPKCRELILKSENENEDIEVGINKESTFVEQSKVFVIFNNLVTQVRKVSFSLAASTFDSAESEMLEEEDSLRTFNPEEGPPSPFRRVVSYGDALKPNRSRCRKRSHSLTHSR